MTTESMKSSNDGLARTYAIAGRLLLLAFLAGIHVDIMADAENGVPEPIQRSLPRQGKWASLAEDGIHDPNGPSLKELQEPREGLFQLPEEGTLGAGNQVRWVHALESGAIKPRRSRTLPETKVEVLDYDVLLDLRGSMRIVRFPHKAHTEWLSCENCHDEIFKRKIGASNIAMYNILNGEQCGRCHGAVSFPVTECKFCHSVKHPDEIETNGIENRSQ
jgi:c(7)-type cytochrome triheme protein